MNNKVKIEQRAESTIIDTEHEYPIYLYYQDEYSIHDYHSKITENEWINISFEYGGKITIDSKKHNPNFPIEEHLLHHIATETSWKSAVENLKSCVKYIK